VIPLCEREGIGQVVWSPLAQGVLTGKYKPGQPLPSGSRAADPKQNYFLGEAKLGDPLLAAVAKLEPIANRADMTMAQLALAWCLRQTNVASVIVGASRPEQVDDNAAASGKTIPPELYAEIDAALAGFDDYNEHA
jgi:aryl-alcohol dehydrogenase-like predicted oxidoreductase